MGGCLSSPHFQLPTAKLILDDGGLKEFSEPVTVEGIIAERPGFFVCDADSMAFDDYLCPLPPEAELQLDQIYFLFPVHKLQYPLPASDMAVLAVKASAAMKRNGPKCGRGKIRPLTDENLDLSHIPKENHKTKAVNNEGQESDPSKSTNGRRMQRMASRKRGLLSKSWKRKLSTIEEDISV